MARSPPGLGLTTKPGDVAAGIARRTTVMARLGKTWVFWQCAAPAPTWYLRCASGVVVGVGDVRREDVRARMRSGERCRGKSLALGQVRAQTAADGAQPQPKKSIVLPPGDRGERARADEQRQSPRRRGVLRGVADQECREIKGGRRRRRSGPGLPVRIDQSASWIFWWSA